MMEGVTEAQNQFGIIQNPYRWYCLNVFCWCTMYIHTTITFIFSDFVVGIPRARILDKVNGLLEPFLSLNPLT